jgi:hypothetical protein
MGELFLVHPSLVLKGSIYTHSDRYFNAFCFPCHVVVAISALLGILEEKQYL